MVREATDNLVLSTKNLLVICKRSVQLIGETYGCNGQDEESFKKLVSNFISASILCLNHGIQDCTKSFFDVLNDSKSLGSGSIRSMVTEISENKSLNSSHLRSSALFKKCLVENRLPELILALAKDQDSLKKFYYDHAFVKGAQMEDYLSYLKYSKWELDSTHFDCQKLSTDKYDEINLDVILWFEDNPTRFSRPQVKYLNDRRLSFYRSTQNEKQLEYLEKIESTLREKLGHVKKRYKNIKNVHLENINSVQDEIKAESIKLLKEITSLKNNIDVKKESIESRKKYFQEKNNEVQSCQESLEIHKQAIAEKKEKNTNLKAKIAELEMELAKRKTALDDQNSTLEKLKDRPEFVKKLKEDIGKMEKEKEETDNELLELSIHKARLLKDEDDKNMEKSKLKHFNILDKYFLRERPKKEKDDKKKECNHCKKTPQQRRSEEFTKAFSLSSYEICRVCKNLNCPDCIHKREKFFEQKEVNVCKNCGEYLKTSAKEYQDYLSKITAEANKSN